MKDKDMGWIESSSLKKAGLRLLNMVRILIILKKSLQQLVECLFKYVMKLNYQKLSSKYRMLFLLKRGL